MIYGYARVSTTGQDLSIQEAVLAAAGCQEVRSEKVSGTSREGRRELDALLTFARKGDTIVVTRIDRLARSIGDLQDIVRALKVKGVALKATEQPIDTGTAAGKAFLDMLGVFAEDRRGQGAGAARWRPGGDRDRRAAEDQPGERLPGARGRAGGERLTLEGSATATKATP